MQKIISYLERGPFWSGFLLYGLAMRNTTTLRYTKMFCCRNQTWSGALKTTYRHATTFLSWNNVASAITPSKLNSYFNKRCQKESKYTVRQYGYFKIHLRTLQSNFSTDSMSSNGLCADQFEISTSPGARKYLDLPTSRAQLFSRVQRANGRFFTFSAAKVNDRARAL